jgi:NAD(P)-dependent dehydrogenase (short-subunit alcohol dehydrogenase family)
MSQKQSANSKNKQVAIVIGATSKWQSDGRNTLLVHGKALEDTELPVGARWGVGGAIAQKFAQEGFFVVLTTRNRDNAAPLAEAIRGQNGECMVVELDLVSQESISTAFATIRREAGDPEVVVYNAGYMEGRELPPEKELLEHIPVEMFDTAQHISSPLSHRQGDLAGYADEGSRVVLLLQQCELTTRAEANDWTIALLPEGDDAYTRASTH